MEWPTAAVAFFAPALQPSVLGREVRPLRTSGGMGGLDQGDPQPPRSLAGLPREVLAGRGVVAGTHPGPGGEVQRSGSPEGAPRPLRAPYAGGDGGLVHVQAGAPLDDPVQRASFRRQRHGCRPEEPPFEESELRARGNSSGCLRLPRPTNDPLAAPVNTDVGRATAHFHSVKGGPPSPWAPNV